jgi:hypothetical protein
VQALREYATAYIPVGVPEGEGILPGTNPIYRFYFCIAKFNIIHHPRYMAHIRKKL